MKKSRRLVSVKEFHQVQTNRLIELFSSKKFSLSLSFSAQAAVQQKVSPVISGRNALKQAINQIFRNNPNILPVIHEIDLDMINPANSWTGPGYTVVTNDSGPNSGIRIPIYQNNDFFDPVMKSPSLKSAGMTTGPGIPITPISNDDGLDLAATPDPKTGVTLQFPKKMHFMGICFSGIRSGSAGSAETNLVLMPLQTPLKPMGPGLMGQKISGG